MGAFYNTNCSISWHRLLRRNPFIVPRNEEHSRRCKFSLFTLVYQVQVYCLWLGSMYPLAKLYWAYNSLQNLHPLILLEYKNRNLE